MSWPLVKIGDIVVAHYGKALKKEERNESGIFDVYGSSGRIGNHLTTLCKLPTLVVGRKGSVGKVTWAPNGGWIIDTAYYLQIKDQINVDLRFLYYALDRANLSDRTITTSIPGLNRDDFYGVEIPLPPLAEQKRIAAILDKADAIRRKRKQAIKLADEFLRSVFLDMFGDPVTIPKGWEVKTLKELATKIGSGSTPRGGKAAYIKSGISLIRSLNIHDDKFLHKDLAFITEKQANELANVVIEKNDVLLNITGASVCRCAIVDNSILPARVNQHVCILRLPSVEPEYLLHTLISSSYKQNLWRIAQSAGATREALTKEQVENLRVAIPPKDLQIKFAIIKRKVKAVLLTTQCSSDFPLFESLSQKAFSGSL